MNSSSCAKMPLSRFKRARIGCEDMRRSYWLIAEHYFCGRALKAGQGQDFRYVSEIAQLQGFDTLIDLLIDSDEYVQAFGEKVPPVYCT
jgi:hypothetical protein